jgi:hypothetical protein
MESITSDLLISILRLSISPVILISGVGLILLSMTNRFGRVIDRSRQLADAVRRESPKKKIKRYFNQELQILYRRAKLLRLAITMASLSLLFAAVLIITLFVIKLTAMGSIWLIISLFIACMVTLVSGLIVFIIDVNVSLAALKIEMGIDDIEGE